MKQKKAALPQRYLAMLKKYLKAGRKASLRPAYELGCQAAALGLETLDLARIHERALAGLEVSGGVDALSPRSALFFSEAITPIEKLHDAALKADSNVSQLTRALSKRTFDLASAKRSLKHTITGRKMTEQALKKSGGHSERLLEQSRRLQKDLRRLTHRILKAHEEKRTTVSRDLQDEIAQSLLAINVRLLTLKKEASVNAGGLAEDIATTQRLLDRSVKRIKRFAFEFGKHHAA